MKHITLFAFASAVAACSSSSSGTSPGSSTTAQPTTEDYEDTAQAVGAVTMSGGVGGLGGCGDVVSMSDAMSLARGDLPFGFALSSRDKHIHGDRLGVDNSFTVVCKDATGATLDKCDRTTDQAQVDVSWSGSLKTPMFDSEVSRQGTWTLTGLQSDTATLSGSSTFSLDSTMTSIFRQGVTSSLTIDASSMYNAILIATKSHELTGGSAAFSLTVHKTVTGTGTDAGAGSGSAGSGSDAGSGSGSDGSGSGSSGSGSAGSGSAGSGSSSGGLHDVDKTFMVTATITFNADQTADLVLNGTEHFTIDLKTGSIKRV